MGNELINPPPSTSYEVPFLVSVLIGLSRLINKALFGEEGTGVNLRWLADVRNWFALGVFVVTMDMLTGTRVVKRLGPFICLLMGCAQLRGPASWTWIALCVGAWWRLVYY